MSPHYLPLLKILRIFSLGDLSRLIPTDLRDVTQGDPAGLIDEILRLIEFAQTENFAATAPTDEETKAIVQDEADLIHIPLEASHVSLADFPLSFRLRRALTEHNFRVAGDLNGQSYAQFMSLRSCGKVTVGELRNLVEHICAHHRSRRPTKGKRKKQRGK